MTQLPLIAKYAGVVGLALAVCAFVLRDVIAAKLFTRLSRRQTFMLLLLVAITPWVVAASSILWALQRNTHVDSTLTGVKAPMASTVSQRDARQLPRIVHPTSKKLSRGPTTPYQQHRQTENTSNRQSEGHTTVNVGSVSSHGQTGGVTAGNIGTVNQRGAD